MHDAQQETLFEFPCEFPIKAFGLASPELAETVLAIIRCHAPEASPVDLSQRPSGKGRYEAITVTIMARSKDQLDAIYRDLTASPMILMAL